MGHYCGYKFHHNKTHKNGKAYLRCAAARKKGCKALKVDCYPGLTSSQITLGDDVLFRLNDCQATGPEPGIEPWEGDSRLSFQFEDKGKWKKRGYTYSEKLNKLYIEMGKPVAVRFSLDSSVMNLRGTVVTS